MALAPASVNNLNSFLAKAEGRDKIARLGQFTCRFILGLTMSAKAGTDMKRLNDNARSLMVQLAGARRTHRWCKEFPVIQSIPKALSLPSPLDVLLEVLQKTSLATFMIIDHVGWLKQLKILSGGKRAGTGTIQLGLSFFCFSNFVAALMNCRKVAQLSDSKEPERSTLYQNIAKHVAIVIQMAHLSRLYETNDTLVGFLGMITSVQDCIPQWPKNKSE